MLAVTFLVTETNAFGPDVGAREDDDVDANGCDMSEDDDGDDEDDGKETDAESLNSHTIFPSDTTLCSVGCGTISRVVSAAE
jgi:hypothetical protein